MMDWTDGQTDDQAGGWTTVGPKKTKRKMSHGSENTPSGDRNRQTRTRTVVLRTIDAEQTARTSSQWAVAEWSIMLPTTNKSMVHECAKFPLWLWAPTPADLMICSDTISSSDKEVFSLSAR